MTRKNLAHARWHYHRELTLFTTLELFESSHGERAGEDLLEWLECMAQARASDDRGMRAWWLGMAGRARRNMMQESYLQRLERRDSLKLWADSYGRF